VFYDDTTGQQSSEDGVPSLANIENRAFKTVLFFAFFVHNLVLHGVSGL